jgi:hypothetical protein
MRKINRLTCIPYKVAGNSTDVNGNLAYNLIRVDLCISVVSKYFVGVFSEVSNVLLAFTLTFCGPVSVVSKESYFV